MTALFVVMFIDQWEDAQDHKPALVGIVCSVITYLGKVLPCAVIGLLVVFCLKDVPESTYYGLPELIAILFIVALHKWKKSTLLSIGGGTVFYMVLVQTIFG